MPNATQRNATQRNATQRNATQRNATQRNATQRNATQRNATQRNANSLKSPGIQVKSKQRVADHGEVFTNEREVNAMLDLVKDQIQNPEKTFLEPACGTGNFLAEILRRKLNAIARKHKKIQDYYERYAVIAVGSLYGIELLPDNVSECRKRLLAIFSEQYHTDFPDTAKPKCLTAVSHILSKNIVCGDALTMKTTAGEPLTFTEWKIAFGNRIKRHDFIYQKVVHLELNSPVPDEEGKTKFIAKPTSRSYPLVNFLELGND
ncbi:DNA methyltransferase [Necropsobacter rosorum]|uniref:DNA methyltransferase n=1 Tax=Necropsobacter rosorum TaxID=908285 RepID=UPI003C7D8E52